MVPGVARGAFSRQGAAITGAVLAEREVNPAIRALRGDGIEVMASHGPMLDSPRAEM
jgi:hypothetical protein